MQTVTSELRRWPVADLREVARVARDGDIEVVHTHQSRAHLFGILLRYLTQVPCVATAHARHFQPHWRWNDYVVANSEATFRYHHRWNLVPRHRMRVVHYLLDVDQFAGSPVDERRRLRHEWRVDESELVAGIIGDVIPRKGHWFAVRAWADVVAALPQAKLVVVGHARDPRYYELVQSEARGLGIENSIV
jgi:glycosyltransferase involved in cell wall biosynthesis